MSPGEIFAYVALALLLASAFVRTIIWLRLLAIAAALVIAVYGVISTHYAAIAIGLVLAAIHAWRVWEMRRLVSATRMATASSGAPLTLDWLLPYMRPLAMPADTILFRKGADADAMYFVSHGRVKFEELGMELGKGALFGEIGIFSHDKKRTATAKVMEDSSLLQITADKVRELYFQNPEFGFFIVGLITRRMMEDAEAGKLRP